MMSSSKEVLRFFAKGYDRAGSSRIVATKFVCTFSGLRSRTPEVPRSIVFGGDLASRPLRETRGCRTRAAGPGAGKSGSADILSHPYGADNRAWRSAAHFAFRQYSDAYWAICGGPRLLNRLGGNGFREFFAYPLAELLVGYSRLIRFPVRIKLVDHTPCSFK